MWGRRFGRVVSSFLAAFLLLQHPLGLITAQKPKPSHWQTLSGDAPVVIARGGFSGLFPDSSVIAYEAVLSTSSPDTISWCDVQLTKDGVGICLPDLVLDSSTNIQDIYPKGKKVYNVNGIQTPGWFSVDYSMKELSQLLLRQGNSSRPDNYDDSMNILAVEDAVTPNTPPALWLNIQNDIFYTEHNLSMRSYLLSVAKRVIVNYVSSPDVAFLRGIAPRFAKSKTKLILRFLGEDIHEPSTNQTYGSLLKNLTFIKTFASGILVPKHYIWPATSDNYLLPYTSIVMDAHKEGLEIYAGVFANDDALISYNYSYDPLAEYLSFIDNGVFSVDGVLSDFPITPWEAIGCFSHINKRSIEHGKPVIISHNGASGIYPDCTDLAFKQAVEDGADFIDCPLQVTSDGVLVCMSSINLMDSTTVANSQFRSLTSVIPEIRSTPGIFTFNLTWEDIQKLKPSISNPEFKYRLARNPRYKNAGNFTKLSDFLTFAKGKPLSGVLIGIENAAFLAERLGFSVTDAVIAALNKSGYSNQTALEVMIQSTNSSVLMKFKQQTKYKLLYTIDESISDADASSIKDIKSFADAVAIGRESIFPVSQQFTTGNTSLVQKLQNASLSVYAHLFRNEFVYQPWDFFSDATVEINSYVQGAGVDGIITDFPGTARAYARNSCAKLSIDTMPVYMAPVQPGGLLPIMNPSLEPPTIAPMPVLDASDIVEQPLPPASPRPLTPSAGGNSTLPASQPSSGRRCIPAFVFVSLAVLCGSLLI